MDTVLIDLDEVDEDEDDEYLNKLLQGFDDEIDDLEDDEIVESMFDTMEKVEEEQERTEDEILDPDDEEPLAEDEDLEDLSLDDDISLDDDGLIDEDMKELEAEIDQELMEEGGLLEDEIDEDISEEEEDILGLEDEEVEEEATSGEVDERDIPEVRIEEEIGEEIEEGEEIVVFECPVCGADVGEDEEECSSCGAVFEGESVEEEEIEEQFEVEEDLEEIDKDEEFSDAFGEAKARLNDIRKEPISLNLVKDLIKESKKAESEGDLDKGIRLSIEAIEVAGKIEKLLDRIKKAKKEIKFLKKKGVSYKKYVKDLTTAKRLVERGLSKKANLIVDEVIADVKEKKDKYEKIEKESVRIKTIVADLNKFLGSAKKFNIPLKKEKKLISEALKNSRKGDINKALDLLGEARRDTVSILENHVDDEIKKIDDSIMDLDLEKREKVEELVDDIRQAKIEEDFDNTHILIKKSKKLLKKDHPASKYKKEIEVLTDLIEDAERIGIDCDKCRGIVEKSIENYEKGKSRAGDNYLKKAKKELITRIPPKLQGAMKRGLKKLEKAKKEGENISKPVTHLKQANLMVKRRDYLKALKHIGKFNEMLDDILGEEEEVTEEKKHEKPKKKTIKTKTRKTKKVEQPERKFKKVERHERKLDREKEEKKRIPKKLKKGFTYIVKERRSNNSFKLFKKTLEDGFNGICVTRQYPDKVKEKYDLETVRILWLSNVDQESTFKPKNLEKLGLELELFLSEKEGVILLDGFEYLISNNDFRTVFHLIQSIKDQVAISDSIMIISASPSTLEKQQMDLLEKEVDETVET